MCLCVLLPCAPSQSQLYSVTICRSTEEVARLCPSLPLMYREQMWHVFTWRFGLFLGQYPLRVHFVTGTQCQLFCGSISFFVGVQLIFSITENTASYYTLHRWDRECAHKDEKKLDHRWKQAHTCVCVCVRVWTKQISYNVSNIEL